MSNHEDLYLICGNKCLVPYSVDDSLTVDGAPADANAVGKAIEEIEKGLSDYRKNTDIIPISKGGTGATTASAALTNLGAAPAGLISANYSVASDTELDAALETVLSDMGKQTVRYINIRVTSSSSIPEGNNEVFIYKDDDSYAAVRTTKFSTRELIIRERSKYDGTWTNWYNPSDYRMEYGYRDKIAKNSNLNDYVSIGNYACDSAATAGTLTNCPTTKAFILNVFSSIGYNTKTPAAGSTAYIYYTQEIINIEGDQWIRRCNYNAGTWSYGTWKQIAIIGGNIGTTSDDDKYIDLVNTVNGTSYTASFGINSSQALYLSLINNNTWKNAIVLASTYTKSMMPYVVPDTQYGSTLPSSGVAGQLFFKI